MPTGNSKANRQTINHIREGARAHIRFLVVGVASARAQEAGAILGTQVAQAKLRREVRIYRKNFGEEFPDAEAVKAALS